MRFVRWKRYGFTHIVDERPNQKRTARLDWIAGFAGGFTVCGNWWHSTVFDRPEPEHDWQRRAREGLLAPSETNDDKRPLCGTCRKYLEKHQG